jgi:hypothetical protein
VFARRVVSRIQFKAEYREEFLRHAHDLDGRWRKRAQIWSFPVSSWHKLKRIVKEIYGEDLELR